MSQVVVRNFDGEKDSAIIYATWPKGAYHAAAVKITTPKSKWFIDYYLYVKAQVSKSNIKIACLAEDPDTIIGYCVIDGDRLEWIYVKESYRKQGIAKLLTKNENIQKINQENLTRIGKHIVDRHSIGETNEQDARETLGNRNTSQGS